MRPTVSLYNKEIIRLKFAASVGDNLLVFLLCDVERA